MFPVKRKACSKVLSGCGKRRGVAQATSASGVSGGIGFGGRRQPSPDVRASSRIWSRALPTADRTGSGRPAARRRRDRRVARCARARDRRRRSPPCRRSCDQSGRCRGGPPSRARRRRPGCGFRDRPGLARCPLAQPGIGRRPDFMPGGPQQRAHFLPRPGRRPGAVGNHEYCHDCVPPWLEWLVGRHGSLPRFCPCLCR